MKRLKYKEMILIFMFILIQISFSVKAEELSASVTVFLDTYVGTFSSFEEAEQVSGEGVFKSANNDLSITGKWENGNPSGKCTIEYADGIKIIAKFNKNGLINGKVVEYAADGSYKKYSCTNGRPFGVIEFYDEEGKRTNQFDRFYQTKPISKLSAECNWMDYNMLLSVFPTSQAIAMEGTVIGVFSSDKYAYVLAKDKNNHYYILTYANGSSSKYNQALVPNLGVGDRITAYGFLQKQDTLSNLESQIEKVKLYSYSVEEETSEIEQINTDEMILSEVRGNTVPFIMVFNVEITGTSGYDINELSYTYEDILRNPYVYTDFPCDLTGEVLTAKIDYDEKELQMEVYEKGTTNKYYVKYNFELNEPVPTNGDIITIKGSYHGNYRVLSEKQTDYDRVSDDDKLREYIIFPRIHADEIEIQ